VFFPPDPKNSCSNPFNSAPGFYVKKLGIVDIENNKALNRGEFDCAGSGGFDTLKVK
jgi:hypothetical protein